VKSSTIDWVFLSYSEPNADSNFEHLLSLVPTAQRIHGVKGFDAAHKAAANASTTDYFVLVDGDTRLNDSTFLNINFDFAFKFKGKTLSFNSVNSVNGLVYGNGGLKIWNRDNILQMRTHENGVDVENAVEFCFNNWYIQSPHCFSTTIINSTPFQAFAAGFREGVKLSLNRGRKPSSLSECWPPNIIKLKTWMSVGSHTENGVYSILGSRLALSKLRTMSDITCVSDFDYLISEFNAVVSSIDSLGVTPQSYCDKHLAPILLKDWNVSVPILKPVESGFVVENFSKRTLFEPKRTNLTEREYQSMSGYFE